ncbi:MAG: hypothetical protein AB7F23_02515 [Phycisphaerae bacterium]|jgi:hypothetical protein
MLKLATKIVSWLTLAVVLISPFTFITGTIELPALKSILWFATIIWFVTASSWMWKES